MRKLYALVVLASIYSFCQAKTDSVSIDLSRLEYASDFEQKQFDVLSKTGTFNPLLFLYCLDSTTTEASAGRFEQKLNTFFDDKLGAAANKNSDKSIKIIFREIHDNLLNKYTLDSRFENVLDKGEYNCVTGSALYALAFEHYHIPYQLRSTTSHVYVIANPGPNQLLIETTDPVGGAFKYSETYKKSYIDLLVKQKLISKEENSENSVETLFQKYFYTSDTINFKQLIGYHYYNNGINLLADEKFDQAVNQLKKAYYLNNNKQVSHVLYLALAGKISRSFSITNPQDIETYFMFLKLGNESQASGLYNDYLAASQDLLVRQDDMPKFEAMSNTLFSMLEDSAELSRYKEHYYYSLAYVYITKKDYLNAYLNTARAYCLNSKNIQVKAMYDELSKKIIYYLGSELEKDSLLMAFTTVAAVNNECEALKNKPRSLQMAFIQAEVLFGDDEKEKANEFLTKAEKAFVENKQESFEQQYAEGAYKAAENYCYRKNDFTGAKTYIDRGLKLLPGSDKLKEDLLFLSVRKGTWQEQYVTPGYNSGTYKPKPAAPRTIIVKTPH